MPCNVNVTVLSLFMWAMLTFIGVSAAPGNTSTGIFGQPGMKYLISTAKFVKFLLSHAKRHGS